MMATPNDLEDFAYGFALTEQIAESIEDIRGVEIESVEDGWQIRIALTGERLKAHLARGRAMSGRTGCGLCGIEDFSQMPSPPPPLNPRAPIEPAAIRAALQGLERRQPLNQLTRAVHGAAWCARDGQIVLLREDVGRHNALDKAIGALARAGVAADSGFFLITSRCSFEMVAKAAIFGAGTLGLGVGAHLARLGTGEAVRRSPDRRRAWRPRVVLRGRTGRGERRIGGVTTAKIDKLVHMANQIGDFYAAMPEREAIEGVATHLSRFWTPKMIRELVAIRRSRRRRPQADRGSRGRSAEADRDGRLKRPPGPDDPLAAPAEPIQAPRRAAYRQWHERRRLRDDGRARRVGDLRLRRRPAGDARRDFGQHLRSPGALAGKGADDGLRLRAGARVDGGDATRPALAARRPHDDRRHQLCRRSRHRARAMGGSGRHAGGHSDGLRAGISARERFRERCESRCCLPPAASPISRLRSWRRFSPTPARGGWSRANRSANSPIILRAVAAMYDPETDLESAYGAAIRQQAALAEQLQSARALLLDRPRREP